MKIDTRRGQEIRFCSGKIILEVIFIKAALRAVNNIEQVL
jgi:hypothetical protein